MFFSVIKQLVKLYVTESLFIYMIQQFVEGNVFL
jgi:hypothetical protein